MNKNGFINELKNRNIVCNEQQFSLIEDIIKTTLETNKKFNLTAITNYDEFLEKMVFDSALGLRDIDLSNKKVIDVGTGAGFPGLILYVLCNDINLTLLDSTSKKINYLKEYANSHNFNIDTVAARCEDYSRKNIEQYDYAYARAVAHLSILLELIAPLLKIGGTFVALKGPGALQEIEESKNALKKLGLKVEKIIEDELPESHDKRFIIHIKKIEKTPRKYPREYKDIKSLPL